jgi:uncharacterized DUF497 family protein
LEFEWDEAKRATNIAKHGLDFARIARLLDGPHVTIEARATQGEQRLLTIGELDGRVVTAVFTWRAEKMRIISLRSARDDEWRRYQALYRGGA